MYTRSFQANRNLIQFLVNNLLNYVFDLKLIYRKFTAVILF